MRRGHRRGATTTSPTSSPSASAAIDGDGDGFSSAVDCNDAARNVFPGAPEVFDNGVDENCDGRDNPNLDVDRDGFPRPFDCDDGNAAIRPTVPEIRGNAVDENCDRRAEPFADLGVGRRQPVGVRPARSRACGARRAHRAPRARASTFRCTGRSCPIAAHPPRDGAAACSPRVVLHRPFRRARLRPGTRLRVTITAAETIGRTYTYVVKRGARAREPDRLPRAGPAEGAVVLRRRAARGVTAALAAGAARGAGGTAGTFSRRGLDARLQRRRRARRPDLGLRHGDEHPLHPLRRRDRRRRPRVHRESGQPDASTARRAASGSSCSPSATATTSRRSARTSPCRSASTAATATTACSAAAAPTCSSAAPGNDNVVSRDGRGEQVDCGAGSDTAISDDADTRTSCEEIEGDADGDGVRRPADCDDTNPGIRPGATDTPDDRVDQDCSGADATNLDVDGDGTPAPAGLRRRQSRHPAGRARDRRQRASTRTATPARSPFLGARRRAPQRLGAAGRADGQPHARPRASSRAAPGSSCAAPAAGCPFRRVVRRVTEPAAASTSTACSATARSAAAPRRACASPARGGSAACCASGSARPARRASTSCACRRAAGSATADAQERGLGGDF